MLCGLGDREPGRNVGAGVFARRSVRQGRRRKYCGSGVGGLQEWEGRCGSPWPAPGAGGCASGIDGRPQPPGSGAGVCEASIRRPGLQSARVPGCGETEAPAVGHHVLQPPRGGRSVRARVRLRGRAPIGHLRLRGGPRAGKLPPRDHRGSRRIGAAFDRQGARADCGAAGRAKAARVRTPRRRASPRRRRLRSAPRDADAPRRLGRTPIPLAGVALPDLDPQRTLREWSFMVPVGAITPQRLATAVRHHAGEPILSGYSGRLAGLQQDALDGYLTGVADFAFEHEGRWYVFDWKSTNLGSRLEDYAPERLHEAAVDRHYILQLYIYALGLHRYLQTRMPDYDYNRHIGGAGVVFLRGIDGRSDNGFYVLRPPLALIQAMDEMLQPVPVGV